MGREDKDEEQQNRKRRHKSPSPRDRDVSKMSKKVKSEHVKEEKSRDSKTRKDDRKESRDSGKAPKSPPPQPTASSTNESSISIEETNRIRAELGLKPLEVGDSSASGGDASTATEKKDVHVPAQNMGEQRKTEELRRKLEERKEKRKIEEKLSQVRKLAEVATKEDDDAASWVEKSRKLQQAKDEAAKRAKMLEEMDEAFGVGEIVANELLKQKARAYTNKDLRGLKVEHDREAISEGKEVVLTLKDQNILEAEEDVLVNVNIVDDERYKKNNEIKKQRPGYQPFEDSEEFDEFGLPKTKSLLAKYDTEIEGEKRDSFVLGKDGDEEARERARQILREKLKMQSKKIESLDTAPLRIASEYYTAEEMTAFKKPKKRIKKPARSKEILKADDLLKTSGQVEASSSDLGSRSKKGKAAPAEPDVAAGPVEDLSGVKLTVTDDAGVETRRMEDKFKRWREKKNKMENQWDFQSVVRSIKREPLEEKEDETAMDVSDDLAAKGSSSIVLNATAEFCRTLGDIPTYGMAGNRDEDEEELLDFERQLAEERRRNQEKEERRRDAERLHERGGWNVLERENGQGSDEDMDVDRNDKDGNTVILDEEPDVGLGVAAALKLAMSKGYLEKEEKKRVVLSKAAQELQAQRYSIEDKAVEDDKYSRRNRFDGPVSEFKEKDGYKPDPKLEYMDDSGKPMTTKEAFRHLSHKFHGKGSGKLKSEKRSKKQDEKMLMNRMSSTDTPLNTLKKLQDKQRELQTPYLVLSGKLATTPIVKPGKGKK